MSINYFCSGFNPENAFFESLANQLKKDLKNTNRIVYIPGANDRNGVLKTEKKYIPEFNKYFKDIGIEFEHVDVITPSLDKELAQTLVKNSDILVLLGGNPFKQKELYDSKDLGPFIKNYNGVIMGVSAGAMNMSKYTIVTPSSSEYPDFDIRPALNLSDISIFPHNNFEGNTFPRLIKYKNEMTISSDLIKVSEVFGSFYLLQDHIRKDGNYNISIIRVDGDDIKILTDNDGKVWKVNKTGFKIVNKVKKSKRPQLILCGGGSGDQDIIANRKLNEIIDHNKPLLYIPLAMDPLEHSYGSCYEWIKKELSNVKIPGIHMVIDFKDLEQKDLDNYSAIFIGGGNTYKLLKGLKETKCFDNIENYLAEGGIIMGSSAGAVIFGYDINIINYMDQNDVGLEDTKGFNILDGVSIAPHYTNRKSSLTEEENSQIHNKATESLTSFSSNIGKVIAIPEEDAIYVKGEEVKVFGTRPYYTFEEGVRKRNKIQ